MFGFFKKHIEKPPASPRLDLEAIDSIQKAEALYRTGALERLFMRPLELGGQDIPFNVLYVPPGIVKQKAGIDLQVIQPLADEGKITKYSAKAEYQGNSVIPIAIKIRASEPETFCFDIDIWGTAIERAQGNWDQVYAAREAIYAEHFGVIHGDVQKLMNLTGVWPGGCLVQIESARHQIWVTSSFGLTNPDMPARTRPEQFAVENNPDRSVRRYQSTLVGRPPRAVPAGRAGYGYEVLVFTRRKEQWPLMFLNWAVQAEILRDADVLGRVHRYGTLTVESISLGDGQSADFLIAPLLQFVSARADLPNGSMELLAATLITRPEMQFGLEHGGPALLERIKSRPQGQISD
jgi:hypothetical protein